MSIVHEMFKMKMHKLMQVEMNFDFPEYMRLIRKTIGFSRRFVAEHIGCSETKISYLERGDYGVRGPDYEFIVTMSHFYGLDSSFMLKKFRKYMTQLRANKCKTQSCVKPKTELSGISGQLSVA